MLYNKTRGLPLMVGLTLIGMLFFSSAAQAVGEPVISDITVYTTSTAATVAWKTDVSATGKVEYGTTSGSYTTSKSATGSDVNQSVGLTDLQANTTYFYRITATALDGTKSKTDEAAFKTPEKNLKLLGVKSVRRGPDKIIIKVSANKDSNAAVTFGTSADTLTQYAQYLDFPSQGGATIHYFLLNSLKPNTTYYYQVELSTNSFWMGTDEKVVSSVKNVSTLGVPSITKISPTKGTNHETLTITGKNFGGGPNESDTQVKAGVAIGCPFSNWPEGKPVVCLATIVSWANTKIVVRLKSGVRTGPVYVAKIYDVPSVSGFVSIFTIKGPIFKVK